MTAEVKSEMSESSSSSSVPTTAVVEESPKVEVEEKKIEGDVEEKKVEGSGEITKSASFKEESSFTSDLREYEKKALIEFKSKLEEAILQNKLFKKKGSEKIKKEEPKKEELKKDDKEKPTEEKTGEETEKSTSEVSVEEKVAEIEEKSAEAPIEAAVEKAAEEVKDEKPAAEVEKPAEVTEEKAAEEEKPKEIEAAEEKVEEIEEVDNDISLWGVPLLPSKGAEGTDVVLLKFLRARDFRVNEALDMLANTLKWRKAYKCDSTVEEEMNPDLSSVAFMDGVDREGHPICFNVYGAFQNNELYQKTFGTEEQRQGFLRWRIQLMEKGIKKLDFSPGGVSSLLQINDLKNTPGPSKKELRTATKQAVALLQDNYPEFVARNIFINVPFWYYAFNAVLSPFLTTRTKSKFVFARPASVTETLLKYIPANEIPTKYGGLKRENDTEFSTEEVTEVIVKSGATETVELPAPEVGTTLVWDLSVVGWEVTYKEEFVPSDEGSYTIIVQKGRKVSYNEEPARNSFTNNEAGKIVLTIENATFKKKKVLYRYKVKKSSS
ncbi:hypothetical protein ACHQM5_004249 [Ranunculus cassubicifolius]